MICFENLLKRYFWNRTFRTEFSEKEFEKHKIHSRTSVISETDLTHEIFSE